MYASLAVVLRMALGSVEIVVEFQYMGMYTLHTKSFLRLSGEPSEI